MQFSLPTETDAHRNHDMLGELCSLSYQPTINVCVKACGGNIMLKRTTCQILLFVITVNVSWQWKLQVAVDYSVQNWKYGIEYLYSHNFGENSNTFFFNFIIVAGSLRYKSRNLGIKISHGCREIAFCMVGYFNLGHPVYKIWFKYLR